MSDYDEARRGLRDAVTAYDAAEDPVVAEPRLGEAVTAFNVELRQWLHEALYGEAPALPPQIAAERLTPPGEGYAPSLPTAESPSGDLRAEISRLRAAMRAAQEADTWAGCIEAVSEALDETGSS